MECFSLKLIKIHNFLQFNCSLSFNANSYSLNTACIKADPTKEIRASYICGMDLRFLFNIEKLKVKINEQALF
jgi:hypothetical protein